MISSPMNTILLIKATMASTRKVQQLLSEDLGCFVVFDNLKSLPNRDFPHRDLNRKRPLLSNFRFSFPFMLSSPYTSFLKRSTIQSHGLSHCLSPPILFFFSFFRLNIFTFLVLCSSHTSSPIILYHVLCSILVYLNLNARRLFDCQYLGLFLRHIPSRCAAIFPLHSFSSFCDLCHLPLPIFSLPPSYLYFLDSFTDWLTSFL